MSTIKRERKNPVPFAPVKGGVYENAGGGRYICESCDSPASAWMVNIVSGWSLTARNIVRYEDGTIEWDYSKDGQFIPLTEKKLSEIYDAIEKQAYARSFGNRQRSLVNAMLCCLI